MYRNFPFSTLHSVSLASFARQSILKQVIQRKIQREISWVHNYKFIFAEAV